jgi:phosphoenolpyruvate---glycerone phosphotransferase subunit DhaL
MAQLLDGPAVGAWLSAFAVAFRAAAAELDELDRQAGDGDFGSNLLGAIERVEADLATGPEDDAAARFGALSKAFMQSGGTSGPLFGVFFRAFARACAGEGGLDRDGLAQASRAGLEAVCALGNATPGDKAMVDAIAPAAAALEAAAAAHADIAADLALAAAVAREAADATAGLVAKRGRASYVGELSRGVRDAGAVAVALFFEAGSEAALD